LRAFFRNGGQEREVGERTIGGPGRPTATLIFEVEAYTDPKALSVPELKRLKAILGTNRKVGEYIGTSSGLVRDRLANDTGRKGGRIISKSPRRARSKTRKDE
jgi:hypothetical protein